MVDQLLVVLEPSAEEAPRDGMVGIADHPRHAAVLDVGEQAAGVRAVLRADRADDRRGHYARRSASSAPR